MLTTNKIMKAIVTRTTDTAAAPWVLKLSISP
jgi:hypothetical protein